MSTWQYFLNLFTNLKEKNLTGKGEEMSKYKFQPNSLKQAEKELSKIYVGEKKGQERERE